MEKALNMLVDTKSSKCCRPTPPQARASVDAVDSQQMTAPPGERIFQQTALFLGFGCAV